MWTEEEFKSWAEQKQHRYFVRKGLIDDDIDWEFRPPGMLVYISLYEAHEPKKCKNQWSFQVIRDSGKGYGCGLQTWEDFQSGLIPLCLLIDPSLEHQLLSKKITSLAQHVTLTAL